MAERFNILLNWVPLHLEILANRREYELESVQSMGWVVILFDRANRATNERDDGVTVVFVCWL